MEQERSLTCSQQPVTCPHPLPDEPSPQPETCFIKIHFNIQLTSRPRCSKRSLSLNFIRDPYIPLPSPVYATCSAHLFLLHLIIRIIYDDENKSLISLLCNVLRSLLRPSKAKISSSAPSPQTPSVLYNYYKLFYYPSHIKV
jgi:hypothetical protein